MMGGAPDPAVPGDGRHAHHMHNSDT
jgi:hypothetical protein